MLISNIPIFLGGVIASLMGGEFTALDIFLPVGISFFTFQSLSYTIDVYRRDIKPLTNLLDYAFYVSFFPQLVAGPIVRARDLSRNPETLIRLAGNVRTRNFSDRFRSFQESHHIRLYQYQFCWNVFLYNPNLFISGVDEY